jgi:hypothetical protein
MKMLPEGYYCLFHLILDIWIPRFEPMLGMRFIEKHKLKLYMLINNFVVFLATIPVSLYYTYYAAQMTYIYVGMAVLFWNTADWYVKALMTSKKFNKEKAED